MNEHPYQLPGGYVDAFGVVHRDVELAPLSGREEEILVSRRQQASAALVTLVLSRCVRRIGSISPVSPAILRDLLVADRQYLLLKLRECTFGDQIQATLECSWPDCRNKIDVAFSTGDIPIRESTDKGPTYTLKLSSEAALVDEEGNRQRDIAFRLPNGGDQEELAPLLAQNEALALTRLLQRCVQRVGPLEQPAVDLVDQLSPLARMELEQHMQAVAPAIEMMMQVQCQECARYFIAQLDLQSFFFGELQTSKDLLYREVHYLAYHYHWSEREIMDMTREQRRN